MFGGETVKKTICEGCARGDNHKHNGIYCKIKDWQEIDPITKKFGKVIKFVDLLK